MEEIEGLPYDWVGYYLHVFDLLSCSQKTFLRNFRGPILKWLGIPAAYHCASQPFHIVNYQQPYITPPHDFYNDAMNEDVDNGWIVNGVYDIE